MTNIVTIVPSYREPLERVRRTLTSIARVPMGAIILVDDGGSAAELDELRTEFPQLEVLHLPENVGVAAAMNAAIRPLAADTILCRLDVGDEFYPMPKVRQLAELVSTGARCSFSPHFDAVERVLFVPPASWRRSIYSDGAFCICSTVMHREVWLEVGGFNEALRYGDDWDFAMRVQHAIGWTLFQEPTCAAGAFPDGHTRRADRDPELATRKAHDTQRVLARGRALGHPDSVAHLGKPKWRRKRGLP